MKNVVYSYNALLAITGAITGTSKEKLYQELGFKSLQYRCWFCELCTFYKVSKNQSFRYLLKPLLTTYDRLTIYPFFILDTIFSKNSFFPSAVIK